MAEVVVDVPDGNEESLQRLSQVAERAVLEELGRESMLNLSDELLKESKLTEEDAIELGRKMKAGRFKYLKKRGLV